MTAPFRHRHVVGWGELDALAHLRNTAYLDIAATARMRYFAACGFPMSEFDRLRFGPVVREDTVVYRRESRLLDELDVELLAVGLSADGARWILRNEFRRADGEHAATVTTRGGWLDLAARRLTPPPPALAEAMRALPRADDWAEIVPRER